jgi:protein-tyrosine-phosphatase
MAAVFARSIPDDENWAVNSAGVHAHAGEPSCAVVRGIDAAAADHLSVLLDAAQLDSADLVITASLSERAEVARLNPRARTKTFTLREALLLGELNSSPVTSVAEYASLLDSGRGMLALPRPRRLLRSRTARGPLDIVDVHGAALRVHRRWLEKLEEETEQLSDRVRRQIVSSDR